MNQQPESSLNPERPNDKMSEEQESIPKSRERLTACVIQGEKKRDSSEQDQKPKRTRKTIEQELAELDAKRQRLMEKKRSQETHEKIVFGTTVIAMLKKMKGRNDINGPVICKTILAYTEVEQPKDIEIINKIIDSI